MCCDRFLSNTSSIKVIENSFNCITGAFFFFFTFIKRFLYVWKDKKKYTPFYGAAQGTNEKNRLLKQYIGPYVFLHIHEFHSFTRQVWIYLISSEFLFLPPKENYRGHEAPKRQEVESELKGIHSKVLKNSQLAM